MYKLKGITLLIIGDILIHNRYLSKNGEIGY